MRQKRVLRENLARGYTQNYTLQPHLPPHNSLAREETMRATRHVPVTYQVLAHTKTPAGCFLSDPAGVFTYGKGWHGSGKPGEPRGLAGFGKNSVSNPDPARAQPRRTAELAIRLLAEHAFTSQRRQTRHRTEILLLVTTGQHLLSKHLVKRHTRRHNRQVLVVQAVGQHHKT